MCKTLKDTLYSKGLLGRGGGGHSEVGPALPMGERGRRGRVLDA